MDYKGIVNIIRDAANYVNASGTFLHGRKSDASLDFNGPAPYIFLLEPRPLPQSNNSKFVINISFPILFVTQDSPESSELEREDLKQDMSLLALRLLSKIDESDSIEQVRFESPEPEIRQMAGTLTGFSFNLLLTYNTSDCAIDIDLPPTIKIFASDTSVSVGQQIELAWIATNVNSVTITGLGVLQGAIGVVNVIVNAETTYTATATNNAGTANDSITIEIGTSCLDATAVVKNTLGTVIATESIPSGATEDIIITDSTAVIKNSLGTTLKSEAIPAEVSENITINNTTVQLKDSASNNIGAVNSYLAESANNLTAPDGTVTVQNTTPTTIATQDVRSNGTATVTLNDITLTINDQNGNNLSTSNEKAAVNLTKVVTVAGALDLTIAASTTTPVTNQSITFTGGCTNGTPTNWRWDFGDGTTSTLQNPTKTYRYAGSYTVTLSATDGTADGFFIFGTTITVTLQAAPTTGLQASYDALIGASPPNATLVAGAISQWNDSSGGGFNLTQGTAINRPTYNDTQITFNGVTYGGGIFDGVNDFLSAITIPRGTASIVDMVWRINAISASFQVPFIAQSAATHFMQIVSSSQLGFRVSNGTINDTTLQYPTQVFYRLRVTFNNATGGRLKFNEFTEYVLGNTGAGVSTGICFGAFTGALSPVSMTLIEAKIYSALSAPDAVALDNYQSSKFGLW